MPKPKKQFLLKVNAQVGIIFLHALDIHKATGDIIDIEGIDHINIPFSKASHAEVSCSPLYDIHEIAAEIEQALSPVPDAFDDVDI